MRQIVLDTETTGIGSERGHRIIEIGCVELVNRKLTSNHFHAYLNPERSVDEGAFKVHGISTAFLSDKPVFRDVAENFFEFVDGAELIIHNAPFDMGFLNAEFKRLRWPKPLSESCGVFDTLVLARTKHPGQRNTLDALCKRYFVDNSNRQWHGALLDAELLALVYLAMTGGQTQLLMDEEITLSAHAHSPISSNHALVYSATEEELLKHQQVVDMLEKKSGVNHWQE
ncbi:MAG: DNA polymerase III subunit epsilon [Legionellales bacterium]|nr:DNA polymerase III subunit epsilon [Legionellales bacterium]